MFIITYVSNNVNNGSKKAKRVYALDGVEHGRVSRPFLPYELRLGTFMCIKFFTRAKKQFNFFSAYYKN